MARLKEKNWQKKKLQLKRIRRKRKFRNFKIWPSFYFWWKWRSYKNR